MLQLKKLRTIWTHLAIGSIFVSSLAGLSLFGPAAQIAQAAACPTPVTDLGTATFNQTGVNLPAGTYKAWVRMQAADATNNAVYLQMNDSAGIAQCLNIGDDSSIPSTSGQWKWVDYKDGNTASKATIALPATTTLSFKLIGREPGVKVDKVIFLLASDTCVPSNTADAGSNPPTYGGNCTTTNPPQNPTINLTSPTNNSSYTLTNGTVSIPLAATASADPAFSVAKVEWFKDGSSTPIATDTTATSGAYSATYNETLAGTHTITAKVTDTQSPAKTATSAISTITVVNPTVLSVNFTAPANNATVNGASVVVAGTVAGANGTATVSVTANGTAISTCQNVAVGSNAFFCLWDTTKVADGAYALRATVTNGTNSANSSINVSVLNGTAQKPGDVNKDGMVNLQDASLLIAHYNTNYPDADFNHNGIVDLQDASVLISNYGK